VIGTGLYMAGLVMLAMGLAIIIRHTAGAITTLVGLVFILPAVSNALPHAWQVNLARYFPANAGGAITNVIRSDTTLSPWAGFGVFLVWVVVILGAGWVLLRRRDVQ
jgi:ABC-2 type transport system permease protein